MFQNAYAGRKVFVTGHTGFKGAWLSAWLLGLGAEVWGYSLNLPGKPCAFKAMRLEDRLSDMRGDVRDASALASAMQAAQPEFVFHLAAQALVRESYERPVDTFTTNIGGTLNVLEAARAIPSIKVIIIITSDKCYKNMEWVWGYRENDRLGGEDPYSASKACAEILAHSCFDSFFKQGAACATVRAGNVIGGGDWARDRIVPDCARAWAESRPVEIRCPQATRPWQHVLEPLSGYLWLAARLHADPFGPSRAEAYNFGPPADTTATVEKLARTLAQFWPGFSLRIDEMGCGAKREHSLLKLCCDKALFDLDWKATLNFEETARYTAEWYARYYASGGQDDMLQYTQGQIAAYANAAMEREASWMK